MIKIEPVKRYKTPDYPDKSIVFKEPTILKSTPKRWKNNLLVGAALSSIILMTFSGCDNRARLQGEALPVTYLTEEEAYNIVAEEAKKYGVIFEKDYKLKDIQIPFGSGNTLNEKAKKAFNIDLQLDGYCKDKKIGFECVTSDDATKVNNDINIKLSELGAIDDKGRIKSPEGKVLFPFSSDDYSNKLKEALKDKTKDMHIEVFQAYRAQKMECEKELREQVIGFLKWLKSEGII